MKLLSLLIILVNLFVLMYEFKYDVDFAKSGSTEPTTQAGQEQILLVNELANTGLDSNTDPVQPQPDITAPSTAPNKTSSQALPAPPTSANLPQDPQHVPTNRLTNQMTDNTNIDNTTEKVLP